MSTSAEAERRRRLLLRAVPISILGVGAFAWGAAVGVSGEVQAAERFTEAWAAGDFEAMHAELTPEAQAQTSVRALEAAYEDAATAATVAAVEPGDAREGSTPTGADAAIVPTTVTTHAWDDVSGELRIPLEDGLVAWEQHLVFPGLEPGEMLARRTRAPERGAILAADRTPLAEGPAEARSAPLGAAATAVTGEIDQAKGETSANLEARGFPRRTLTGTSGLELAFNERLQGQPGGRLLAVREGEEISEGRTLAKRRSRPGEDVRTTLDPTIQQAAVSALGDAFGGIAALDARDGSVRALAGIAFSAPQPPGSTFKIVTTAAALEEGLVTPGEEFPVETGAVIEGREVANAHDETCGGSFAESFAHSCNSVFAPLGVEVGAERLVQEAEEFGFNAKPALYNEEATAAVDPPESTIPSAEEIGGDLDVGVSAIGQGKVLATPLQLASIAQAVASGGDRTTTPITKEDGLAPTAEPVRAMDAQTARTLRELMVGVVSDGTGSAAALSGVQVAGKTGTAELGPKALEPGQVLAEGEEPEQEVDAWFTAFAPAAKPRLAVAAMIVNADGDGGTVAAPIVREVLDSAL